MTPAVPLRTFPCGRRPGAGTGVTRLLDGPSRPGAAYALRESPPARAMKPLRVRVACWRYAVRPRGREEGPQQNLPRLLGGKTLPRVRRRRRDDAQSGHAGDAASAEMGCRRHGRLRKEARRTVGGGRREGASRASAPPLTGVRGFGYLTCPA